MTQQIMQAIKASKVITQRELDMLIIRQVEYMLQQINDSNMSYSGVYNGGILIGLLLAAGLDMATAENLVKEVVTK